MPVPRCRVCNRPIRLNGGNHWVHDSTDPFTCKEATP